MLGAMAAQPKVRKVAQRQQRTKLGVLEKPKEVKNINTEDKQVHCQYVGILLAYGSTFLRSANFDG